MVVSRYNRFINNYTILRDSLPQFFSGIFSQTFEDCCLRKRLLRVLGRREWSVLPAVRPFLYQEWILLTGDHWCIKAGLMGTKIIFAEAIIRHRLWQVLGVLERSSGRCEIRRPPATCPVGVPLGSSPHQHDLICPFRICFWLLHVRNFFLRKTVFPLSPVQKWWEWYFRENYLRSIIIYSVDSSRTMGQHNMIELVQTVTSREFKEVEQGDQNWSLIYSCSSVTQKVAESVHHLRMFKQAK